MGPKYLIIAFTLDTTVNPCGTPCRSIVTSQTSEDPEEALRIGLWWEQEMWFYRGTAIEYDEVQVIDMTGFDWVSKVEGKVSHV